MASSSAIIGSIGRSAVPASQYPIRTDATRRIGRLRTIERSERLGTEQDRPRRGRHQKAADLVPPAPGTRCTSEPDRARRPRRRSSSPAVATPAGCGAARAGARSRPRGGLGSRPKGRVGRPTGSGDDQVVPEPLEVGRDARDRGPDGRHRRSPPVRGPAATRSASPPRGSPRGPGAGPPPGRW